MRNRFLKNKPWLPALVTMLIVMMGTAKLVAETENPLDKRVEINVRGASLLDVLNLIARNAGLKLSYDQAPQGSVSFGSKDASLYDLLSLVTRKNGLTFSVNGGNLMIHSARLPSRAVAEASESDGDIILVRLNYAKATVVTPKIAEFFSNLKNLKLVADDINNTILVGNAGSSMYKIRNLISQLDLVPKQILIEAKIVETSSRFVRDLGMSWGNIGLGSPTGTFGGINNPVPSGPNLALGYRFGWVNQRALDVKLTAAESRGEAKIISRPKIVTADRTTANIKSGITYYIKTLAKESDQPANGSSVSGGLTSVSAGLSLDVTPVIVENGTIQMQINISNSEADQGNAIDGIPGIVNSSAKTSIMVKEGITATIAGLIKYQDSTKETGVPILSWLPIFGNLFKGVSKDKQNRELVIFITPTLVSSLADASPVEAQPDLKSKEPEVLSPADLQKTVSLPSDNISAKNL